MMKIIHALLNALAYVYIYLFGHPMGSDAKKFFKNLSWSFIGGIIASSVMLVINVVSGRYLGPRGYGEYGLVLAISQLVAIPILFGLDVTSLRAISASGSQSQKKANLSSALYFVILSSLLISIFFLLLRNFISQKYSVDVVLLSLAVIFAIVSALKSIVDSFARGLLRFKSQFISRILEVAIVTILFTVFFIHFGYQNYISYIVILIAGSSLFIGILLWNIRNYLGKLSVSHLKSQLSYSVFIVLGSIFGGIFNALDKFLIVRYLSIQELGIYMAYYTASTNLIAQGTQIFMNALFPQIAGFTDGNFLKKIEKIFLLLFVPGWIILSLIIYAIVYLFGKNFELSIKYVLLFGLLGVLQIIYTIYASVIMAISKQLYKRFFVAFNITNILHIAGYGILIYISKVSVISIVGLFCANIAIMIYYQRKLLRQHFSGITL